MAVLVAALLAALLLAACGSSNSNSTETSTGSSGATETSSQSSGSQGQGESSEQQKGASESSEPQNGSGHSSKRFTKKEVSTPLRVSGGGSSQFRAKGGDNSIQEFGEEAGESELQEAAETVHGFYVARATGDWKSACSYLSKSMLGQLEKLASSSTELADKSCPSFLATFTSPLSAAAWREITTVDAGSLRHEGEQAFLIYYGPEKTVYSMPLKQEEGAWKVGALSGVALPGA